MLNELAVESSHMPIRNAKGIEIIARTEKLSLEEEDSDEEIMQLTRKSKI